MECSISTGDPDCHSADSSSEAKRDPKKNNKPVMEKKRRAKINGCLSELKSLILDALHKDPARHSKLEKADILEMTVRHLQTVQRQQLAMAVTFDPSVLVKVKGGFRECGQEVARYVGRIDGVDGGLKKRLLSHVDRCVSSLEQMTPLSFSAMASPGLLPAAAPAGPAGNPPPSGDLNNNRAHARLLASLQTLMASRLLTGDSGSGRAARAPATATSAPFRAQPSIDAPRSGACTPSAFERVRPTAPPAAVVRPIPIPLDLKKRALEDIEDEGSAMKRARRMCSESSDDSEVSDQGHDRKASVEDMWRPW